MKEKVILKRQLIIIIWECTQKIVKCMKKRQIFMKKAIII